MSDSARYIIPITYKEFRILYHVKKSCHEIKRVIHRQKVHINDKPTSRMAAKRTGERKRPGGPLVKTDGRMKKVQAGGFM